MKKNTKKILSSQDSNNNSQELFLINTNKSIITKNYALVPFKSVNDWTPYRLQTKTVGLTYSRFPVLKEEFIKLLKENFRLFNLKNKRKIIVKYDISCNDYHGDKGLHIHALLVFDKKIQLRDAQKVFALPFINELGQKEYRTAHFETPKQKFGNHLDLYRDYIIKKGNFLENGVYPKRSRKQDERDKKHALDMERLRLESSFRDGSISKEQAIEKLEKYAYEMDNIFFWDNVDGLIKRMCNRTFVCKIPEDDEIYDPESYLSDVFELVKNAILELMSSGKRKKSLFIVGGTGIGKTRLVKTVLRILNLQFSYIKGKISFAPNKFDDSKPVVIMDDISVQKIYKLDPEDGIKNMIGNGDTTEVDVKMSKTVTITGGKLFIYIVNPDKHPEKWCEKNEEFEKYDHIYVRSNIKVIEFDELDYNQERPLFLTDKDKEIKKRLHGLSEDDKSVELAKMFFGEDKVEVLN